MKQKVRKIEPFLMAVLSRRFETITKEMTGTMLRTGRSITLNTGRDFSCGITTADNRLIVSAEGLPVHVVGIERVSKAMTEFFDDIAEGDCFLHNSPYYGNTHHADFTIIDPVFYNGKHLFTAIARAHQADIGNALPTTYMPFAKDLYEEGCISFPCIRIQRNYKDIKDIIRMCRENIRVPQQWYGDYLAQVGSVRVGERALKELCNRYGADVIKDFIEEWMDYGESRMVDEIKKLPKGTWEGDVKHDPIPGVAPDGIPIHAKITIDPSEAYIIVDLTDNIDCIPGGFNESEACSANNAAIGVLNCLAPDIPHNSGSLSHIKVKLRKNCVVGYPDPEKKTSVSMATTNVGDRIVSLVQSIFSRVGEKMGMAEGGCGMPPPAGVWSGTDPRRGNAPYIGQTIHTASGGPALYGHDGWYTYGIPVTGGVLYNGSVEVEELEFPMMAYVASLLTDSGGAGQWDGGPGGYIEQGPTIAPIVCIYPSDGHFSPPKGIRGGQSGSPCTVWKLDKDRNRVDIPQFGTEILMPGEKIVTQSTGGGGYGDPLKRDPERVRHKAREGWISVEKAREVYGVVLDTKPELYAVDYEATKNLREELRKKEGRN